MAKRRIFQIAKELNISHTEILSFLEGKGISVASHMAPIEEDIYKIVLSEFHKDKESVERYRKEQVRREIHDTRILEQQKANKKLNLLSLEKQRELEEKEKKKEQEDTKAKEESLKREAFEQQQSEKQQSQDLQLDSKSKKTKDKELKKVEAQKKKDFKSTKKTFRKVELSEIESQVGKGTTNKPKSPLEDPKKLKSTTATVKKIKATLETKSKKKVYKKDKLVEVDEPSEGELKSINIAEFSNIDELSKILEVPSNTIIQKCMGLGVLATINQRLDWDIIELLAEEFGYEAKQLEDIGEELFDFEDSDEDKKNAIDRPPVITVMGHVDHGKTSLLDYIRESNVVAGESGGITQHIGAYQVALNDGNMATFLDTPGHEAFTAMRARGAKVTDIVVLVVAANDGVMPQTKEAIDHANAANVPLVIAINKIDLPDIDLERVKRELSENNVLVEDWGGKIQAIPISAKTGQGVEDLLSSMIIECELLELKANKETLARGTVVDSKLDKGHGPIATVLIQKGTLSVGDPFICNNIAGKVRAMMNERGQRIKTATPSTPVQILGFDQVPQSADIFAVVENEREIKRIVSDRQRLKR